MYTVQFMDERGIIVGAIVVNKKAFKTGSRGYYGNTKLELKGKRYQVQVQLVEIGSKNNET
jgi:hypothetical protein